MGYAHLAFGNLRSVTSLASCLDSATTTGVRLAPEGLEEDSMRRSDSLMLVTDRERCAATDSPKGYPLIQLLTLSSRRKYSLQKEPPLLLVRRPILRVCRTGMGPSSLFRRQARHPAHRLCCPPSRALLSGKFLTIEAELMGTLEPLGLARTRSSLCSGNIWQTTCPTPMFIKPATRRPPPVVVYYRSSLSSGRTFPLPMYPYCWVRFRYWGILEGTNLHARV